MMNRDGHEVERKVISILRILHEAQQPMGARVIARSLKKLGVELGERAVRYHLKIMDERGLTEPLGRRDGRKITSLGIEELNNALVVDKVGFVLEKIELLVFKTSFDLEKQTGLVPVNVSLLPKERYKTAFKIMEKAFSSSLCVSDMVAVASEGEKLGDVTVPEGKIGFATVCSLIMNGSLFKAGIPIDSKFGGVLQIRNGKPLRFVDLIYYSGSSVDPSEVFIKAGMTDVQGVIKTNSGKVLANFRELPAQCQSLANEVIQKLKKAKLGGLIMMGNPSEEVCGISVGLNRVGMILLGGLTPIASLSEAGIDIDNKAMSTLMEYQDLVNLKEVI
jgi:repressor of nif and glnA expression